MPVSVIPRDYPNAEILGLKLIWVDRYTELFLKVYGNRNREFPGRIKLNTGAKIGRNDCAALKVDPRHKNNV